MTRLPASKPHLCICTVPRSLTVRDQGSISPIQVTMIRQTLGRIDPKRRNFISHKKQQFADATYKEQEYPHRLNVYDIPPTAEVTLEEFEQWAIDRLRSSSVTATTRVYSSADFATVLAELEACSFRNKTLAETSAHITPLLNQYLPLSPNSTSSAGSQDDGIKLERKKDHYSHFILRLAFSSTEDLRRRFTRIETALFRLRFLNDNARERQAFVESLEFNWQGVSEDEKRRLAPQLINATPGLRRKEVQEGSWFKVDWETVPELVENRKVFVSKGKAYVPAREQMSMVLAEFSNRLDQGLEVSLHQKFTSFNL